MTGRALAPWLALAALAAQEQAQSPAPPVFRAGVESVYVDVLASRGGQPVPNLEAADFELRDDGVRQSVELVDARALPLLAVLVFDVSSSTAGEKLAALQAAGVAFLDGLQPGDQVSLLSFSEEIARPLAPTSDREALKVALARLQPRGATALMDALFAGLVLADVGPRPLVVLFTDGDDNTSWLDSDQLRVAAERSNAVVHVVSWSEPFEPVPGPDRRPPEESAQARALRWIAEATGGRFWQAASGARLGSAFVAIADSLRHRYLLRYDPPSPQREGWHRLDVRVRGPRIAVQARPGYFVAAPRPAERP